MPENHLQLGGDTEVEAGREDRGRPVAEEVAARSVEMLTRERWGSTGSREPYARVEAKSLVVLNACRVE
jgi:hypothetical protein